MRFATGTMAKLGFGIAAGLAVALFAGWIWGASGRSDMARALQTSERRGELLGARAALLDARVAICGINFAPVTHDESTLDRLDWGANLAQTRRRRPNAPLGRGSTTGRTRRSPTATFGCSVMNQDWRL